MINRPKVSSILPSQVPEFIREDYTTFVEFLQAYYEFLDENYGSDFGTLRDLDKTLDSFVEHFKNELSVNIPFTVVNERFLLEKIKDQYLAKGSEASFKLLFKLLFNKQVTLDYPSRQILRASDGKWNQDVSLFVYVNAGDPDMVIGKMVDVVQPTRILRVQVDKRQYVEVEVDNVVQISDHIYELFIDRRFFGDIAIGDKLRYSDIFDATILATTSKVTIQQAGKKFKLGELYEIKNGEGKGSILKVAAIDDNGGVTSLEFVKYGIGYATDFTATLLPYGGVSATTAGATALTIVGSSPSTSVYLNETSNGFYEQGTVNTSDYNVTGYWSGAYVGDVVREFYEDNKYAILDADEPAIIKVTLGPLTKYPGYYTTNDGFLDDAIFIQDSRYYQAFAYVVRIDERLDKYRSAVKTMLHPAGMALFGEFDIRNEFDTGTSLEFALKYLFLAFQDEAFTSDVSVTGVTTFGMNKPLSTHYLYDGVTADTNTATPSDSTATLVIRKPLSAHYLYGGVTADTNTATPSDSTPTLITRKGLQNHYLYGGVTADTNAVTASDTGISSINTTKTLNSLLYNHYLFDGTTLDTDTVLTTDTTYTFVVNKSLNNTTPRYLFDGTTLDTDTVTPSDEIGANGTRTVPYFTINKPLGTHYLYGGVTADTNSATAAGSGGGIWLNSYTDFPYPSSSAYFANDSGNYTTGESTFTG